MEEPTNTNRQQQPEVQKHKKPHLHSVIVVRDWKEYLGEAILIVFSVLLALVLTELFNSIHEKHQTAEVLRGVRQELIENEQHEKEQYAYHLQVLKNIDSALAYPEFQKQFIKNGTINLSMIAPHGVMLHDLNDVAWEVAKQDNIVSKIDLPIYSLLTNIYDNQERITKTEQEIANVILSRESRIATDNRVTLILMHDNYHGWAVDRAPALLADYRKAIDALQKYE